MTGADINLNLKLRVMEEWKNGMEECQYSIENSFEPVKESISGVGIVALSRNKQ